MGDSILKHIRGYKLLPKVGNCKVYVKSAKVTCIRGLRKTNPERNAHSYHYACWNKWHTPGLFRRGALFFKILQYLQENTYKRRLQHRCFSVNILKFLRTPILKNICDWLHLWVAIIYLRKQHLITTTC